MKAAAAFFTLCMCLWIVLPHPVLAQTGGNDVAISLGTGTSLTVNISGDSVPVPTGNPNAPHMKFSLKLSGADTTPEIKVRLRLVDIASLLSPTPGASSSGRTCMTPAARDVYYKDVSMVANANGVYTIKPNSVATQITSSGTVQVPVGSDGWMTLSDAQAGRIYSVFVKGPKHRDIKMVQSFSLGGGKATTNNFDWTSKPLEPGDLPNPNYSSMQDCTVNSIDLSLIISRIGSTDQTALSIADVNYDGVVNGNDVSKVVFTLSTKPDDDE